MDNPAASFSLQLGRVGGFGIVNARHETEAGLTALAALLREEYDAPLSHWTEKVAWTETDALQIARALEILIIQDFADSSPRDAPDELGSRKDWQLSDVKIAAPDWETAWQFELLAYMDNASKAAGGGMVTPSDPRQYLLRIRYGSGVSGAFAAHMSEFFCTRGHAPQVSDLPQRLLKVPGLARASSAFLAGLALMIEKLGFKGFCAYCDERC